MLSLVHAAPSAKMATEVVLLSLALLRQLRVLLLLWLLLLICRLGSPCRPIPKPPRHLIDRCS